jgi:hypothetical protein
MHDGIDIALAEKSVKKIAIRELAGDQVRAPGHSLSMTPAEVIEHDDLVPGGHELSCDDAPDVSGSPSYQNLHAATLMSLESPGLGILGFGTLGLGTLGP